MDAKCLDMYNNRQVQGRDRRTKVVICNAILQMVSVITYQKYDNR